ncbi:MAG: hypothetical protein ACTJHT_13290 [Sphingobacterium sp.]
MLNQELLDRRSGKKKVYFRIADHLIAVSYDQHIEIEKALVSFGPFVEKSPSPTADLIAVFDITTAAPPKTDGELKLLSDVSIILDERFRFEESTDHYITSIEASTQDGVQWKMRSKKDFTDSVIYARQDELYTTFKCTWLIMVAFGQGALAYNTILLHSSVIEKDGKGYAFLGKSGTGKSTHSRLWLAHIDGSQLLNDDNPAVRVHETGEVLIYGTPWSGKTHCYRQKSVKLGAIVRLQQAPINELSWKGGKEALLTLLPSGSAIRWNSVLFSSMLETLQLIVEHVPVGNLQCLPDRDAAFLSYSEVSNHQ